MYDTFFLSTPITLSIIISFSVDTHKKRTQNELNNWWRPEFFFSNLSDIQIKWCSFIVYAFSLSVSFRLNDRIRNTKPTNHNEGKKNKQTICVLLDSFFSSADLIFMKMICDFIMYDSLIQFNDKIRQFCDLIFIYCVTVLCLFFFLICFRAHTDIQTTCKFHSQLYF